MALNKLQVSQGRWRRMYESMLNAQNGVLASLSVSAAELAADAVETAKIKAGALSADAAGRAKFASDFFDAATTLAKFATDSISNAVLLKAVADGAFVADANTQALFADGFMPKTKLAAAVQASLDLADAGMAVTKRTVTIAHGDLTDADGEQTFNVGAVLPANARVVGYELAAFTGFQNAGDTATYTLSIGADADADAITTATNIQVGQTGFPKTGTAGASGYPMCSVSGAQITAVVSSNANVVDATAGSVTVNFFYVVLA